MLGGRGRGCGDWILSLYRRANKYIVANGGGEQRIARSSSFRLSGRKKSGATTDPVDEFRAHHRTEGVCVRTCLRVCMCLF